MDDFHVWAPRANSVALKLWDQEVPMKAEEEGWWRAEGQQASHGTRYQFILDGGQPLPDPRSPWQPEGVHGPSAVVDHSLFQWSDSHFQQPPLSASVIYELHVGTFSPEGTFDGVIGKLDYLRDLGITHIELMPVAEFPGERGWGYDGVDLYAPHHAYGGPDGLKRLVNACHQKNLGVILDVVYNHLGPDGNYLGLFGPYFTDRYGTPWGEAVNLDGPGSDEVRRFFMDNARMWLRDYHIDGLRLDAVHTYFDMSAVHMLEELSRSVNNLEAAVGRWLIIIAESDLNDPRVVRPPEIGGYGIDSQWSDDFHHALHTVLTGESASYYGGFGRLSQLAKALENVFVYDGNYSAFRERKFGSAPDGISRDHFLGYLQNHDQIGNRAGGERIGQIVNRNLQKIGAAIALMSPFVPMLFQGEEWDASTPFQYFTDHQDPELGKAVSEGRRKEFASFGWQPEQVPDPQSVDTFNRSRLNWTELSEEPHAGMLAWYRDLITLRRRLRLGAGGAPDPVIEFDEKARWLVMQRGQLVVICNFSNQDREVPLPGETQPEIQLASRDGIRISHSVILIPSESVVVLF